MYSFIIHNYDCFAIYALNKLLFVSNKLRGVAKKRDRRIAEINKST